MAKSHAIRTLEKKRADLKVDLAQLQMLREKTLESLSHIEMTLALFQEMRTRPAQAGPLRRWVFRRGELRRLVNRIECEAGRMLTHREVARAIIALMGWDREDRELVPLIIEKVKASRRLVRRCREKVENVPSALR